MSKIIQTLCRLFRYKEIGWKDIGETFYRWTVLRTRWFSIYIHYLDAPQWHSHCHDHPWRFVTLILSGGYYERLRNGKTYWQAAGTLLHRGARFAHNVKTKPGAAAWSVVFVGPKQRSWGMMKCESEV